MIAPVYNRGYPSGLPSAILVPLSLSKNYICYRFSEYPGLIGPSWPPVFLDFPQLRMMVFTQQTIFGAEALHCEPPSW